MKYDDNGVWKTLNVKVTDTLPVGTIIPYAGTTIPSNYMKCEGQELSRIEYDILFSAIGTTYGAGDGSTTFNLPNLKGRVITGIDSNDTAFDTLGEAGGEKTHTLTVDEMPSHAHELGGALTGETKAITNTGNDWAQTTTDFSINDYIKNTGGGQPHNIMQPYIVLNYIIKVSDAPATITQAQVVDEYSTSSRDSYSCNYVNSINTYSTDEIRVGTWIDGKPLYRKVLTRTGIGDLDISSLSVDTLMIDYSHSYVFVSSLNRYVSLAGTSVSNDSVGSYQTSIYANSTKTTIRVEKGTNLTTTDVVVTIEYTKTTD